MKYKIELELNDDEIIFFCKDMLCNIFYTI